MGLFGRIDGAEIFARSYDIAFLDNFEDVRGPPAQSTRNFVTRPKASRVSNASKSMRNSVSH